MSNLLETLYCFFYAENLPSAAPEYIKKQKKISPYMDKITEQLGVTFTDEFCTAEVGLFKAESLATFRAGILLGYQFAQLLEPAHHTAPTERATSS